MINDIVLTNEYPKVMKEKGEKYKIGTVSYTHLDVYKRQILYYVSVEYLYRYTLGSDKRWEYSMDIYL